MPSIYDFISQSIHRVTYNPRDLKAVVGVSGGLDSSVTTWLTAEAMRRAKQNSSAQETSLVLLAFRGMSEEDLEYGRRFADQVRAHFSDLPIDYLERDLTGLLRSIDRTTDDLVRCASKPKVYSGELATRLIDCVTLEFANKSSHCSMDSTNYTEIVLGEINLGAGCECAPQTSFYKSQVWDLAEIIGVPQFVLDRPPINSTFGHSKVAGYFAEIPENLTPREVYRVLDLVLFMIYDLGYQPGQVAEKLGHSIRFVDGVARRLKRQNHRRQVPNFVISDDVLRSQLQKEGFVWN